VSTHFAITHELDATPEEFWRVFHHEPYNVELYQRIGVKERTVLDRSEDDATIKWAVRIVPKRDLPSLIKKVIGGDLGYTEISTYHKGKNSIDVRVEPTLMKERTKIQGVYTVAALGPRRIRRTFEGDIHFDMPIVGKKIEATVLDDMRRSYDVAAQVTAEWLARGGVK
jgi:hypothetical protein